MMSSTGRPVPQRRRLRQPLHALACITLDSGNGGIVTDLSEGGMGIQAVAPLEPARTIKFHFDLLPTRTRVEGAGRVVWANSSGRAGVRFVLQAPSEKRIKEFLFFNALSGAGFEFSEGSLASFPPAAPVPDTAPLPLPPPVTVRQSAPLVPPPKARSSPSLDLRQALPSGDPVPQPQPRVAASGTVRRAPPAPRVQPQLRVRIRARSGVRPVFLVVLVIAVALAVGQIFWPVFEGPSRQPAVVTSPGSTPPGPAPPAPVPSGAVIKPMPKASSPYDAEMARSLQAAAEGGDVNAQSMLGQIYLDGAGIEKSYLDSYTWSAIAATAGDNASKSRMKVLAPLMTPSQVAAAEKSAAAWLKRHRKGSK